MTGITTSNLAELPDLAGLKRLMQSLAMLDATVSPEWEYRYYSFNSHWAEGEMMGSMRNGSGDELFALFTDAGCFIKGFDHEAFDGGISPEAFYAQLPLPFADQAKEPAFSPDDVTFCYWRRPEDREWQRALVPAYAAARDGSSDLLELLDGEPESYRAFARDYYEQELDLQAVTAIYAHRPLTVQLAGALNPDLDYTDLAQDAVEIGYPASSFRL